MVTPTRSTIFNSPFLALDNADTGEPVNVLPGAIQAIENGRGDLAKIYLASGQTIDVRCESYPDLLEDWFAKLEAVEKRVAAHWHEYHDEGADERLTAAFEVLQGGKQQPDEGVEAARNLEAMGLGAADTDAVLGRVPPAPGAAREDRADVFSSDAKSDQAAIDAGEFKGEGADDGVTG